MRTYAFLLVFLALTFFAGCGDEKGMTDGGDGGTAPDSGIGPDQVYSCKPKVLRDKNGNIATKFALAMFHYNLQYVATDDPAQRKKYEDGIVKIGFEPLLDLFKAHPSWNADIEMQGYFIETMQEKYPETLKKLKDLVRDCRTELVSFHYSDQLFLAYGKKDMEWSDSVNHAVFDRAGLHPSGVVFTQEGQFGEGMMDFMAGHGMNVALYPMYLYSYWHEPATAYPLWEKHGAYAVPVGWNFDWTSPVFSNKWWYYDDGELLITGGLSPYFIDTGTYKVNQDSINSYVEKLNELESQGYVVAGVGDYVETLKALALEARPLPDSLDGTWNPGKTNNIHRWMGGKASYVERDNDILTANFRARNEVLAAETIIAAAAKSGVDTSEAKKSLEGAVRDLMLAEVSDSTGWTPSQCEIDYSLNHAALATEAASKIIASLKSSMKLTLAEINTETGEVKGVGGKPAEFPVVDCPAEIKAWTLTAASYSTSETKCRQAAADRVDVEITFQVPKDPVSRVITLEIPADLTYVEYTPALMDGHDAGTGLVKYPSSEFLADTIWLGLANGLVGIGPGKYLVKDCGALHLAGGLSKKDSKVKFIDEYAPIDPTGARAPFTWRISVITGTAEAAYKWARKINTNPTLYR
jgi:hypothetical protein